MAESKRGYKAATGNVTPTPGRVVHGQRDTSPLSCVEQAGVWHSKHHLREVSSCWVLVVVVSICSKKKGISLNLR